MPCLEQKVSDQAASYRRKSRRATLEGQAVNERMIARRDDNSPISRRGAEGPAGQLR